MLGGFRGIACTLNAYRRTNLREIVADAKGGSTPPGDWIQLVGAAYDRATYAFGLEATQAQDEGFIQAFNARANDSRINIFFHNCADFARQIIDFYYPNAVRRSYIADVGIMTPKQAAKSLVSYGKQHQDLQFSTFVIPQVRGTIPRSTAVRKVLECVVTLPLDFVVLVTQSFR